MLQVEMACILMLRLQSLHGNALRILWKRNKIMKILQGPKTIINRLPQTHCPIQEQIMLLLFTSEEVFAEQSFYISLGIL